jgi:hypothetical protein
MHPLQPPSGDLQPDLAVPVGCYSAALSPKSEDFHGIRQPLRCFFLHISENSGSGSGGELR